MSKFTVPCNRHQCKVTHLKLLYEFWIKYYFSKDNKKCKYYDHNHFPMCLLCIYVDANLQKKSQQCILFRNQHSGWSIAGLGACPSYLFSSGLCALRSPRQSVRPHEEQLKCWGQQPAECCGQHLLSSRPTVTQPRHVGESVLIELHVSKAQQKIHWTIPITQQNNDTFMKYIICKYIKWSFS